MNHSSDAPQQQFMLQIIGDIPDLSGCVCEALVKQEYWHLGQKKADVNVLFLKLENSQWHRFFFDSGVFFWKEVDAPDVWNTTAEEEFHYPHVEVGEQNGIIGLCVDEVTVKYHNRMWELYIGFSSGKALLLQHWYEATGDWMNLKFAVAKT